VADHVFNGSFLCNFDLRHDGRVVLNHSKCDSLEILFGFAVKVDLDRVIGSPNAVCDTSGKAWPFFLHNGAIVLFMRFAQDALSNSKVESGFFLIV